MQLPRQLGDDIKVARTKQSSIAEACSSYSVDDIMLEMRYVSFVTFFAFDHPVRSGASCIYAFGLRQCVRSDSKRLAHS